MSWYENNYEHNVWCLYNVSRKQQQYANTVIRMIKTGPIITFLVSDFFEENPFMWKKKSNQTLVFKWKSLFKEKNSFKYICETSNQYWTNAPS